jgi:hypothetical protein
MAPRREAVECEASRPGPLKVAIEHVPETQRAACGVPLRAMCTVSVEAVCVPARGERINRCGVGALAGFAAVLAWVAVDARAVPVVVEVPPPQPLATRPTPSSSRLTQP